MASIDTLAILGDPRAAVPLVKALALHYLSEAVYAALARLDRAVVIDALILGIIDSNSFRPSARYHAAELLGTFGDIRVVEPLLSRLDVSETDEGVRAAAAKALGQLGDRRAVVPLIGLLNSGGGIAYVAAEALGELGDVSAIEPLIDALVANASELRRIAARSLQRLGEPKWIRSVKGRDDDIDHLADCGDIRVVAPLIRAAEWGNVAAGRGLAKLGDARGVGILSQIIECKIHRRSVQFEGQNERRWVNQALIKGSWRDAETVINAAKALGDLGDERAVPSLIEALASTESGLVRAAAESLGKLGDPRAVSPLSRLLEDSGNCSISETAVRTLGQFAGTCAVEHLIRALTHTYRDTRRAAAEALGETKDTRSVAPLIIALGDADRDVRHAAAESLAKLHDTSAVEPLIRLLGDQYRDVRRAAAAALECLGEPVWKNFVNENAVDVTGLAYTGDARAIEALIWVLRREPEYYHDEEIKGAADILGQLGDARAVAPLISALGYLYGDARCAVANALAQLGNTSAIAPLIQSLGDADGSVRSAVAKALSRFGERHWSDFVIGDKNDMSRLGECDDARAIEPLTMALQRGRHDHRRAAAEALKHIAIRSPNTLHNRWHQVATLVRKPHADGLIEVAGDWHTHRDVGIGMQFPDPPTLGNGVSRDF